MARGSQAEQAFAAASETPLVTVAQTARELKQSDLDLWLRTGRGRREAHVSERHLVNLLIAVATGTPSKAVENVTLFRGMVRTFNLRTQYGFRTPHGTGAHIATTQPDTDGQLFSGEDLGADLETFVRLLAVPEDQEKIASMRAHGFVVTFATGARPSVEILWRNALRDGWDRSAIYQPQPGLLPAPIAPGGMRLTTVIDLPLFECLADLWRDTVQRTAPSLIPSPSGTPPLPGVGPGNENAALPGAAPRRPRANAANGFSDLWHSTENAGERQRLARGREALGNLPFGVAPHDAPHHATEQACGAD